VEAVEPEADPPPGVLRSVSGVAPKIHFDAPKLHRQEERGWKFRTTSSMAHTCTPQTSEAALEMPVSMGLICETGQLSKTTGREGNCSSANPV
jgi:hypothetical protein